MSTPEPIPLRRMQDRGTASEHPLAQPAWPHLARALRTASGLTQEGWAAQLGLSEVTIRRWESGAAVPTAQAEAALQGWCRDKRLFRQFAGGPLPGVTLTPELLSSALAAARLGTTSRSGTRRVPATLPPPLTGQPESAAAAPGRTVQLPAPLTTLIGRAGERAALGAWLDERAARLITLTGVGGTGKTRLAVTVARDAAEGFPGGVWFVDLAPLSGPALVPQTVAAVLDVRDAPGRSFTDGIVATIAGQRLLLLLDNCEHLLTACTDLVSTLLHACPALVVLATSREPLRVAGEHLYPVPPLPLPVRPEIPGPLVPFGPPAQLEAPAVQLFVDRARLVRPDVVLLPADIDAVADICRRLDGLPLAIELAAARIRGLSPRQIAGRLDDRFRLIARGGAGAPRHQTLSAMLDWSHHLLTPEEQTLLHRLSVFRGGCTLEAVEHVCSGAGIEEAGTLPLLLSLTEKSLVVADMSDDRARYRLLESVREYADARLGAGAERERVNARHARWYLTFTQDLEARTNDSPHQQQLDAPALVIAEFDNLRAAFEWCLAEGAAPETALTLVNSLWWFWPYHTHLSEGRRWYERALAAAASAAPEARAAALAHAGMLGFLAEDYPVGLALATRAADQARALNLPVLTARALRALGLNAVSLGDLPVARASLEEAVRLTREAGARRWLAHVLDTLAFIFIGLGDAGAARRCLRESLAIAEAEQMLILVGSGYLYVAMCDRLDGDTPAALVNYAHALEAAARIGHRIGIALIVAALALSVADLGYPREAAHLLGYWQGLSARLGISAPPRNRADIAAGLARVRARLGDDATDAALAAGRSMSLAEVQAMPRLILDQTAGPADPRL